MYRKECIILIHVIDFLTVSVGIGKANLLQKTHIQKCDILKKHIVTVRAFCMFWDRSHLLSYYDLITVPGLTKHAKGQWHVYMLHHLDNKCASSKCHMTRAWGT